MNVWVRNLQDRPTLPAGTLIPAAAEVFSASGVAAGDVGVAWVDDATMRREHNRYLGVDTTTDVLSFAADGDDGYQGDIVICTDQARRQALEIGHPYPYELMVLFLHGLLHLLGHDHTRDRGEMRRLEEALRPRCAARGTP